MPNAANTRWALLAALLLTQLAPVRADVACGSTLAQPGPGATCVVTAGTSGTLLRGRVISPSDLLVGGEVLLDAAGVIACAACDCSATPGYAAATRIECPNGVISPGLIDGHRLLGFEQNNPYTNTGERYEHRHDWRVGQNGHTAILATGSATADAMRWGELRALLSGTTSIFSSQGVAKLARNLTNATNQDGLGQTVPALDTFPLGDSNGTTRTSDCTYPNIAPVPGVRSQFVVAEGIRETARNEFRCLSNQQPGGVDRLPNAGVMRGIGINRAVPRRVRIAGPFPCDCCSHRTCTTSCRTTTG